MLELLSPAGSPEAVRAAVQSGADAVYLGYGNFNARRNAVNFDEAALQEAVQYCHLRGVKVYLTLNTLLNDRELTQAAKLVDQVSQMGVDALLVQDLGVARMCRQVAPDLPLHASTQMTIHSLDGAKAAADLGMTRVVVSRELSRDQIAYLCDRSPVEIECFVHGALCMCYSGQCFFSSVIGGRSGNRGMCAQPCRLNYGWGQTADKPLLSLKDMSLAKHLQELEEMGVACAKIEGRMKTALYVATVARTYRKALDDYAKSPKLYQQNMSWSLDQISNCTYRQFTTGFFYGKPSAEAQIYDSNTYIKEYTYLGIIGDTRADGRVCIEQRNKFLIGDQIEIMKPDGSNVTTTVLGIENEDGEAMESAPHPKQVLWLALDAQADRYDILRMAV